MDTNKRQFIFAFGVGWCGTNSLWYTLTQIHDYLHTGITKKNHYLSCISKYTKIQKQFDISDIRLFPELSQEVTKELQNYSEFLRKANDKLSLEELSAGENFISFTLPQNNDGKKFITTKKYKSFHSFITDEFLNEMAAFPPTIEKFVKFYDLLSKETEGTYPLIGNFSNENLELTGEDLISVRDTLSLNYNIKCLIIFRDPIRRAFSNLNYCFGYPYQQDNSWDYEDHLNKNIIKVFKKYISDQKIIPKYAQKVLELQQIFGKDNVCYLIMEDFFKDEKNNPEVIKLEQYLNIKFNSIFPCAFVPDKGINAPRLPLLRDQWGSDIEILSPELYEWALSLPHIKEIYDEFEELHGSLPADWGRPIDYGY